ncbi:MAG: flavin reductase [Deltaproteobacteria bacterium CG11_big_fil_rev_8_21_14_0_20_47_16]|nr:MAG: flavin reductase [Deltaproteobacteria bacterium CG11_big_fil_rev_8_21_14_0_20_47_16]
MILTPDPKDIGDFYKHLLRIIVPRPIAWVSTISKDGVTNLAPYSFANAVSSRPPAHLFCPANHEDGSYKDSLRNAMETGEYVCNVVSFAQRQKMIGSAHHFPAEVSEFSEVGIASEKSHVVQPPRVKNAPAALECKVLKVIHLAEGPSAGNIVIGEIVAMHLSDSILKEGKVDSDLLDAIGRMGGLDYCRTTERFSLKRD